MSNVPPRSPSFPQVLSQAVVEALAEVQTAIPAEVSSYDAEKQLVTVQPLVQQLVLNEEGDLVASAYPEIPGVPVVFPGANGFRMTFPITKGDTVLLVFASRSIDRWKSNGGQVDPEDTRTFHLSDAIAIPGLHPNGSPWTGASTSSATLGKDGGPQAVFKSDKIELGGDAENPPTDALALASKCMDELNKLKDWASSAKTTFGSHTHSVVGIQTAGSPVAHTQTAPVNTMSPSSPMSSPQSVGEVKSTIILAK